MKPFGTKKVFSEVAISADNVVDDKIFLLIKVTERPRISSFSFKGDVTKSQADDLKGKMNFCAEPSGTPKRNAVPVA
ncbi:MAG: hypothetical protein IPN95_00190 [Bacteroidetes bacterium]|nr:hypothetical protein [Bacteroidota bacterium]